MLDRLRSERDASAILVAMRRWWWLILIIAGIAAGGAYVISKGKTKQYKATASLLFVNSQLDQTILGNQVIAQNNDPGRQAATNLALLQIPTVATRVATQLHI